jgi:septation ring formation regulator EzrA
LPKQLEIEDTSPEAGMSNEQIEEFYEFLAKRLAARAELAEPPIAPGTQTVN